MFRPNIRKNFSISILLFFLIVLNFSIYSVAFADDSTSNKSSLESKLQQQEGNLKNDMSNIGPNDDDTIRKTTDAVMNSKYEGFNAEEKSSEINNWTKNFVIKTRSTAIITYALFVVLDCFFMATLGSRSINLRRKGLLLLKGNTIIFLIFINLPLGIIYFSSLKENLAQLSVQNIILGGIDFFRENSFIILILMIYLGVSKIIISKNDLPNRKQGKYLIKAAIFFFIIVNLLPLSISFIIT
ncbi:hypothetical protein [uncultured Clostridium sp.]|uniref:hypothetical protein n=1 Tax=uncultured Clostridium sp. TaxID=59620 RepID=UPI0028E9EBD4|nr:hypothetical protein [uncultured Clostridium sp.]